MVQLQNSLASEDILEVVTGTLDDLAKRFTRLLTTPPEFRRISQTEFGLLDALVEGPRRITELAEMEALDQRSVSVVVGDLERRGLVVRGRAGADGRVALISITAEGVLSLASAPIEIRSVFCHATLDLPDDDPANLAAASQVLERHEETRQRKERRA